MMRPWKSGCIYVPFWVALDVRLGSILGSTWGQLGVHLGVQERLQPKTSFWSRFDPFWNPSWALSWPQHGGLGASWSGLGPFYFRSDFQVVFGPHFEAILDPKTTPKSIKNRTTIHAKIKLTKTALFQLISIDIRRECDAEAKTADLQKTCKNIMFLCIFWTYASAKKQEKLPGSH